jgi:signal transduction histidine kinase
LSDDLLNSLQVGIWICGSDRRVLRINATLERYFGFRQEEVVGKDERQLLEDRIQHIFEDPDDFTAHVLTTDPTDTYIGPFECHVLAAGEREERWLECRGQRIRSGCSSGGRMDHYYDISARKRLEGLRAGERQALELLASGASLQQALTALIDGLEQQTPDMLCSVLLLDEAGKRLTHGAAPQLPNDYTRAIDGVEIGPTVGSCGAAAYRGSRVVVDDISVHPFWTDFRALALRYGLRACWSQPIVSSTSQVLGTFAMYYRRPRGPSDPEIQLIETAAEMASIIIERKRAAELAQRHQAQLAHVQRLGTMGEMASGLAHELNQPLAAISNYAAACMEQLRSRGAQADGLITLLEEVTREARQAGDIIHHLRDFVRNKDAHREPVELGQLIGSVGYMLDPELLQCKVTLRVDPLPEGLRAYGDAIQIEQVLVNLARNAIEAICEANDGGGQLQIQTAPVRDGEAEMIEIAVSDNGKGISDEVAAGMFEAFFTTKPAGLGMGLAISRSIVEAHGGRLWMTRNAGPGVTVRFTVCAHSEGHIDGA